MTDFVNNYNNSYTVDIIGGAEYDGILEELLNEFDPDPAVYGGGTPECDAKSGDNIESPLIIIVDSNKYKNCKPCKLKSILKSAPNLESNDITEYVSSQFLSSLIIIYIDIFLITLFNFFTGLFNYLHLFNKHFICFFPYLSGIF